MRFRGQIFISKRNYEDISYQLKMIQGHIWVTFDTQYQFSRPNLSFIKNGRYHYQYDTVLEVNQKNVQFPESIL